MEDNKKNTLAAVGAFLTGIILTAAPSFAALPGDLTFDDLGITVADVASFLTNALGVAAVFIVAWMILRAGKHVTK
jgi:hypothetical protein